MNMMGDILEEKIKILESLIQEGGDIANMSFHNYETEQEKLKRWSDRTSDILSKEFGAGESGKFCLIQGATVIGGDVSGYFRSKATQQVAFLVNFRDDIVKNHEYWSKQFKRNVQQVENLQSQSASPLSTVEQICTRFHVVVKQLKQRHNGRPTLEISDEYDVQDLFHALLKLFFDDIRPEEHAPSYAGSSSRMDFLLKSEKIVIEVKKTRNGLGQREVGEQLIVDIEHYKKHPDCKLLFCFVYDPEEKIPNPRGLENDLRREEDEFKVEVFIAPKRY